MMKYKGPDLRVPHSGMSEDYAVLRHVLRLIKSEAKPGWALEFGVATGTTLGMISRVLPVIGFDSFQGLPEDWRPGFGAGMFEGVRPTELHANSTLVEGLFEDTVPGYEWPEQIALVHIDCDLYSSTKTVLDALAGSIHPGTYIVFDEFFGYEGSEQHEERAFNEWVETYGIEYVVIGHGREQLAIQVAAA